MGAPAPSLFLNMNLTESEDCPGTVGLLWDETPPLTQAHVRPFIWSILLYRGAVRPYEVVGALTTVCSVEDLKEGAWDPLEGDYSNQSRAEQLVLEVLGELVYEGLCRYNEEKDIWVLSLGENRENLPKIIALVCDLNGAMPDHILSDLSLSEKARWAK